MTKQSERPGKMLRDELMSKHTTWRVGGPADVYHAPRCRAELLEFFRGLDASTPVYWVGFGSNLLVRDGGIRGVVIATSQALGELRNLGGAPAGNSVRRNFLPAFPAAWVVRCA